MRTTRLALLLPPAFLLANLTACPGELDNPERFIGSCPDIETQFFPQRCGTAGCHNADSLASAGNLDLTSADVASRLVGVEATNACGLEPLVDPSDPEGSVLYIKMTEDFCGPSRMPLAADDVTDVELGCVRDWIASLSPSGGTGSGGSDTGGASAGGASAGGANAGGASAGGASAGGAGGG